MNDILKELIAKWEYEADDLEYKNQNRVANRMRDCIDDIKNAIRLIEADQILKGKK